MDKKSLTPMVIGLLAIAAIVYWHAGQPAASTQTPQALAQAHSVSSTLAQADSADDSAAIGSVDGKVPIITFDELKHDFGTVPQGSNVTHVFAVHNTGEAPLKLIKAKAP
jgi:hypothetical protein